MRGESLERGILPREFGLAEHGVNLFVSRPAEQHDHVALLGGKGPANACAFVKRARDEVMSRELWRGAATKCAGADRVSH